MPNYNSVCNAKYYRKYSKDEQYLYYGYCAQPLETDEKIIKILEQNVSNVDLDYDDMPDYICINFSKYTTDTPKNYTYFCLSDMHQDDTGYYIDHNYWFKIEPIK